jgi:hypothetical protein
MGITNQDQWPFFHRCIILLPKLDAVCTPDAFRPISLQNCHIKAIAKVLTNQLKPYIPLLIHADQSGFISGRCISKNFVYAAELLNCCHKRKAPAMVIKLDFRKAFDSISWKSLQKILKHRGFPRRFRRWIKDILKTGKTAILLNGVPRH